MQGVDQADDGSHRDKESGAEVHSPLSLAWRRRKVPLVLQTEAAECGLACLAMVAGAHGGLVDLPTLRARFQVSMKGSTAADVADFGGALGLVPRAVRAELEDLAGLTLPCILHWDLNHFVVLARVQRGVAWVLDPAQGERRMSLKALSPHFTGIVLEFTPGPQFRREDQRQALHWRQLTGPVIGLKRALGHVLTLALVLELLLLLSPFLLQWVVDEVLPTQDRDLLWTLGLGFIALVALQAAAAAARAWAILHLSATWKLQWLGQVFSHLLRLPLAWFERRHIGDIWSRFSAVQQIQDTLSAKFAEAVIDGVMALLIVVLMWAYSAALTALALSAVALYGTLRFLLARPMREASEEALIHEARKASHFLESLRGVGTIKLFNGEVRRQSRFLNRVVDAMNASLTVRRYELWLAAAQRLISGVERVLVVWLGALAVIDHQLSIGMLFAFLAYQEQFASRATALIDKAGELRLLRLQGERLADIVLTPPEAEHLGRLGADRHAIRGDVEFRGLRFRYADFEPEILCGLDLRIAAGESVAIVGPSGCGKTTLLKLLLGIHEAQAGEILIDGEPLASLGRRRWRGAMATVMQDDTLFAGSILDNITFFDPQPELPWAYECARMASIELDILALPMGYSTLVGDMGSALSGGQKQRIVLARALYKRPRILLLDEATSALDLECERLVNEAIRSLALTRIIVAHRPETIASADRLVELRAGRVVV
jgi:ATP-binding cassette subfamily B protein RaxB